MSTHMHTHTHTHTHTHRLNSSSFIEFIRFSTTKDQTTRNFTKL